MDKKSKIFFSIFFFAIFVVAVIAFEKFYILKDYYIKTEVDCDPAAEKCFIYECDPTDDGECPENPTERISYYKLIEKKASAIPLCDPSDTECPPLACLAGEACQETLCDEATKTEDEVCSDPIEYLMDQVQLENSGDCGPEDENCLNGEEVNSSEDINPNAAVNQTDENTQNQPRDIFQPIE